MAILYRNIANICSILGVLPFVLLLRPDGFQFLPILIVYNNVMDDLDGYLAKKLGIQSRFGAQLDNLCDGIAHVAVVWAVAVHFSEITLGLAMLVTVSMILRITQRLENLDMGSLGSPSNELMRHILFLLVFEQFFGIRIEVYLWLVFGFHSLSLIAPFKMPHQLRANANTPSLLLLINLSLGMALWVPSTVPFIMSLFMTAYVYSFIVGGLSWIRVGRPQHG